MGKRHSILTLDALPPPLFHLQKAELTSGDTSLEDTGSANPVRGEEIAGDVAQRSLEEGAVKAVNPGFLTAIELVSAEERAQLLRCLTRQLMQDAGVEIVIQVRCQLAAWRWQGIGSANSASQATARVRRC